MNVFQFVCKGALCMKRPREADGELSITMQDGLRRVAPYWFKCAPQRVLPCSDLVF
jgi:hypothetical protein